MRKQRELLGEKKHVERQKQLEQFVRRAEHTGEPQRPMSSRAARSVLSGVEPEQIVTAALQSSSSLSSGGSGGEERKRLEARKALAATLKREVIGKSNYKNSQSRDSQF